MPKKKATGLPQRRSTDKTQGVKRNPSTAEHLLVLAKLRAPRITAALQRPALFKKLDAARRHGQVVWIGAEAGAGKTTLAASYLVARRLRHVWYQLDERDRDAATFFYYLREAAAQLVPRARQQLPLFTSEYALGPEIFTRNFFEQLAALLKTPCLLVFDNWQLQDDSAPMHGLLAQALAVFPETLSVVFISRYDPPEVFSGLLAQRRVQVLGGETLALSLAETRRLARSYHLPQLPAQAVARLHEQAHGWAGGIVLMLEQVRREGRAPVFDQPVTRVMFDYFASEILLRASLEYQHVLLETAVLSEVSVAAAAALTGNAQAANILAELVRRHYFTYRLAGAQVAFQYHPLFRDFLLERLRQERSPEELAALYRRAASHAETTGDQEEVLRLWCEAGAWVELSRSIVRMAQGLLEQGRGASLAAWIERIPAALRERDPWLQLWMGQARLPVSLADARTCFETAYTLFHATADHSGVLLAAAAVIDSIVLEFGDLRRLDPWIERLERQLGPTPEFSTPAIRLRVTSSMAVALLFRRGQREEIASWVEQANSLLPFIPHLAARSRLAVYLSLDATWTGDLPRLDRIARDVFSWNRALHGARDDRIEMQYAKYVQTLHEWISGTSDYGKTAALEALAMVESSGIQVVEHHLVARAIFGALCVGDLPLAKSLLDRLRALAASSPAARLHMYQYHYLPGWYALLAGDFDAALRYAEESLRTSREAATPVFHQAFSAMVAARALLELKRVSEARPYIDTILEIARRLASPIVEFSGRLLQADMEFAAGDQAAEDRGLDFLTRVMALGRAHGYLNTVVWCPSAMARCCARALAHNIETRYVRQIVRERALRLPPDAVRTERWPWSCSIHTLGAFRILRADGSEPRLQRKPLELLKAVIALGARDVSLGALQQAIWPDGEGGARTLLDTNLYRLRAALGESVVLIKDGRVSLDREQCWVDVWAFEQSVAALDAALAQPTVPGQAVTSADALLRLYRGLFLAQEPDAVWAIGPRERLRSKFLRALAALAAYYEKTRRYPEAIACVQRALEVDVLAESCYRMLMRCYLAQNARAEALVVYRNCREILHTALGLAPAPETEALRRQAEGPGAQTAVTPS